MHITSKLSLKNRKVKKMNQLKKEMKKQNITGYRLSQLTGISSSDLYNAIAGKKPMFPGWKKRISEALNVPMADLFEEDER